MSRPDADTLAELIGDCADIPGALHGRSVPVPQPRAMTASWPVPSWEVDEACAAQLDAMDDYGS